MSPTLNLKEIYSDRQVSVLHVFNHRLNRELNSFHNTINMYVSHVCKMNAYGTEHVLQQPWMHSTPYTQWSL